MDKIESLIENAKTARSNSYSPYSNFQVGAAILTEDDLIYTGCNVENSSYSATICAERSALSAAINSGYIGFKGIAVVTNLEEPAPPCGVCLQVLYEFANEKFVVILANLEGKIIKKQIKDFLPYGFKFTR
jgi:cytidine deaminase